MKCNSGLLMAHGFDGITLVTGAAGFVGRHLAARLAKSGVRLRAAVRPGEDASFLRELGAEVLGADLRDPETLPPLFEGRSEPRLPPRGDLQPLDSLCRPPSHERGGSGADHPARPASGREMPGPHELDRRLRSSSRPALPGGCAAHAPGRLRAQQAGRGRDRLEENPGGASGGDRTSLHRVRPRLHRRGRQGLLATDLDHGHPGKRQATPVERAGGGRGRRVDPPLGARRRRGPGLQHRGRQPSRARRGAGSGGGGLRRPCAEAPSAARAGDGLRAAPGARSKAAGSHSRPRARRGAVAPGRLHRRQFEAEVDGLRASLPRLPGLDEGDRASGGSAG